MSLADAFGTTYDPYMPLNAVRVLEDEFHRDVRKVGEGLEFDFSTGRHDEASTTYQTAKMIDDIEGLRDRILPLGNRKNRSEILAYDWANSLWDRIDSELDESSGEIRVYEDGTARNLKERSANQVYHHAIDHFEDVKDLSAEFVEEGLSDEFIDRVSPEYAKK
jgi:hypothetical protein